MVRVLKRAGFTNRKPSTVGTEDDEDVVWIERNVRVALFLGNSARVRTAPYRLKSALVAGRDSGPSVSAIHQNRNWDFQRRNQKSLSRSKSDSTRSLALPREAYLDL
jgi:hypothetical protein